MTDQKEQLQAQTEAQAEDGKELTEAEMQDVVGGIQPDTSFTMPINPNAPTAVGEIANNPLPQLDMD